MDEIIIDNLTKKFNDLIALDKVNLTFELNKTYVLVGHNGAGKTTLLKHILGIYDYKDCSSGNISYKQNEATIKNWKSQLSYSPELYTLFEDLTIIEYLNFAIGTYGLSNQNIDELQKKLDDLLELFEISKIKNKLIHCLSNGMKRKVSHIAAIINDKGFCVLDEPFQALDPVAIYNLKKYVSENYKKQSFIISTHSLPIIDSFELPDEDLIIILMCNGKVLYKGVKSKLLKLKNVSSIEKAYLSYYEQNNEH